jgi:hypothetical protein
MGACETFGLLKMDLLGHVPSRTPGQADDPVLAVVAPARWSGGQKEDCRS